MKGHKRQKKQCHKVVYHSQQEARQALKEFGRARGATRAYRCPHHPNEEVWHLTSEQR